MKKRRAEELKEQKRREEEEKARKDRRRQEDYWRAMQEDVAWDARAPPGLVVSHGLLHNLRTTEWVSSSGPARSSPQHTLHPIRRPKHTATAIGNRSGA